MDHLYNWQREALRLREKVKALEAEIIVLKASLQAMTILAEQKDQERRDDPRAGRM